MLHPKSALHRAALWLPLAAASTGCVVAKEGTWTWEDGVQRVVLELGNGDAEVVPSGTTRTHLELSFGGVSMTPMEPRRQGDTVFIDLVCEGVCGGDAFLEVPDEIAVEARVHRGDLHVEGLLGGSLDAIVGAGDLSVVDVSVPRIGVAVGAGDGSVEVEDADCVSIQVGAGDASLDVPAGKWRVTTDVGAGHLEVGRRIIRSDDADRCLSARVQAGHLEVYGR